MSFLNCASRNSQKLLVLGFLLLVRSVLCHEQHKAGSYNLGSILEPLDGLREYVESIVGTHALQIGFEFVEMLLKFVAEGAASGLNVIAVYVSEILRATGVNESISSPHFTTEGVSAVIKWALLALTGYSILSLVLRVTVALVRRVFWLVKVILVLWLFVRIVSDPSASTELIGMRLTLLVLICAVFGIVTSSAGGTGAGLEERVRRLEGQFKMEKKKTE
ncbi:uncharacterized protein si:dkey-74k8.3 isoform X2 [Triplophysa dalaica]|uniref:uncharacterized protein si:dkey-74k8.3 isoform X2 n=1 Tax=Triplophysa dalaica TaxID=1582913 RepID=UPI0024DF91FC|nr:uncharacterized protein si:dkey-74k8.3 isoform X2 [Triplophysa dalaica]